jgi:hypothetical protein
MRSRRARHGEDERQGRHASRPAGFSPSVVAVLLIGTLVVAAAGLVMLGQRGGGEAQAEEPDAVEEADPFEGLPPEVPPSKRKRGERSRD